jgi:hypothetical protein
MLAMFALGVASLIWMALLTALTVHEKTRPTGARTVPFTGITLLALGTTLLLWGAATSPQRDVVRAAFGNVVTARSQVTPQAPEPVEGPSHGVLQ